MKKEPNSIYLLFGILFLCLSLVVGKYCYDSVAKQVALTSCRVMYESSKKRVAEQDYKRALKTYAAAVRLFWEWEDCRELFFENENNYLVAGNCYCGLGQYKVAIDCYKQGLKISPYSIALYAALGNCAELSGDFARAISYYEKSRGIFPYDNRIQKALQDCRQRLGSRINNGS